MSHQQNPIPNSPPPSFRSRASSPAHATSRRPGTISDVGPTLEDTFNVRSDDEDDEDEGDDRMADDRRRLMHSGGAEFARGPTATSQQPAIAQASSRRPGNTSSFVPSNDGVFANLSAKPEFGEKLEDQPPVSHKSLFPDTHVLNHKPHRPTNKQQPMPHRHTGKPPFLHQAWPLTKSSSMDCQ